MMRVSAVLALILALASVGSANADYPDKPVRVVVPVAAGGGVDVMARLLAQKLSERLGQQFVVENRAGAAGVIGTKSVIASPADGTTLLYTPSSLSLTVAVHKTPPYDVAKDLTPIINVAVSPYALVVHPSLPVRDLKEFIAYAKANPGKLSYSSAGVGSASHLAGELLKTMAGIDMVHVPNKGMNPRSSTSWAARSRCCSPACPACSRSGRNACAPSPWRNESARRCCRTCRPSTNRA
jgi:tripartite-type tricarboxylate transporter receptor subunit TctC